MRNLRLFLFFIVLFFALFIINSSLATTRGIIVQTRTTSGASEQIRLYSEYYALVVGCGQYTQGWPPLPNPVKDAQEVAALLEGIGWRVDVLMDPEGAKLRRELNRLVIGVGRKKDKAILVWFSGHGQTIEEADGTKLGYLVPVDAPDPDKDLLGFMEKSISMRQIETVSKQIRSKHVLMAFDSCFSGAIFQMVRSKPSPYIQQKVTYPVRQFITAGREDEQVPDQSVFKEVFIQGIKEGFADLNQDKYVTGEELGSYMQEQVTNYSRNAQHPQFGKINNPRLDKGDFVFVLEQPQSSDPNASTKSQAQEGQAASQEDLKLAYIPEDVQKPTISLREEPKEISEQTIKRMVLQYDFYEYERNPYGNFVNDFMKNGDGTITDRATGLMWQEEGSTATLRYGEAQKYIKRLNKQQYAGHSDWRLPTVEELVSLLKNSQRKGVHIDSAFGNKQAICWTADDYYLDSRYTLGAWIVSFKYGKVKKARWWTNMGLPGYRGFTDENPMNYVKAVRPVK